MKRSLFSLSEWPIIGRCLALVLLVSVTALSPVLAGDPSGKAPVAVPDAADADATLFPVPDYTGNLSERSTLTGDWGGARTELANQGVQFDLRLTQIYQGVIEGGNGISDWENGASADYIFKFDFEKMGLGRGSFLQVNAETYVGEHVNGRTRTLLPVNHNAVYPLPGENISTISSIVFTQFLSERFGVFAGKLDTTQGDANAFASGKGDDQFMNLGLALNPVAALTSPYSTLGAGAFYLLDDKGSMLAFNIYDPNGSPTRSGFDSFFKDGITLALETRIATEFLDKPGHHLLGGTWSNKDYVALGQDARFLVGGLLGIVPLATEEGSWSAYYNFDQYLVGGENGRGFGVFGRAGFADEDTNIIEEFYSFGVGGKGLCANREDDSFGLGYYYMQFSDALPGLLPRGNSEQGWEIFYNVAITPWFTIGADLQVVNSPLNGVENAVVGGLRSQIRF